MALYLKWGFLRRRAAHLYLWSDSARWRSHMFCFRGHFNHEFCIEDERKKKKAQSFS